MNGRLITNYMGQILRIEGIAMVPAMGIAVYEAICGAPAISIAAFGSVAALLIAGGTALTAVKPTNRNFFAKDGFITVALSWVLISLAGCLPFIISGTIPSFINALFETVSGFTTTGASILIGAELDALRNGYRSILYWRSFTHWLGGMGVLVFMLALLPGERGALRILRAESPGPTVDKMAPHLRDTARILYAIYIGLTVIEFIFLAFGGMDLFDALCMTFGTAGTGGFGVWSDSAAHYSNYCQIIIGVFMLLFGVNFNMYYLLLLKQFRTVIKSSELKLYFGIIAFAVLTIAINISSMFASFTDALHQSFFQVSSIITTTGFATTDFNVWPQYSRMLLLGLMCIGACAGSTGGGLKIARVIILGKALGARVQKLLHPHSVQAVRIDGRTVGDEVTRETENYFLAYVLLMMSSMLIISLDGFVAGINGGLETAVSAVIACFNNIGPGLASVGPVAGYTGFSVISKLVLCLNMLFGRLEIFPMLMLFLPSVWRKAR